MSEVIVLLLELHGIKKTPPGKLASKADFLCLLYGSVDGMAPAYYAPLDGFRGKIR